MATRFDSFDTILRKAVLGFTQKYAETSDAPEFPELLTRRYPQSSAEVFEAALRVIERFIQWRVVGRDKNMGGVASLKCEIVSVVLGGNTNVFSMWMIPEPLPSGEACVTVNAKSVSQVETKGDLGENRRHIAFFLEALDKELSPAEPRSGNTGKG